jgi:opacity protein-like surface antigen
MNVKLIFRLLFLVSVTAFAQDKKWSVEANYGVIPNDGFSGEDNVLDFGFKYRFADFKFMQLGVGVNGGFSRVNFVSGGSFESLTNSLYLQPRFFSEFIIPGSEKLKPSIGLGYSIVNDDYERKIDNDIMIGNVTNGGFNFNVGFSYDITKSIFVQVQYDFIYVNYRDQFSYGNATGNQNTYYTLNNVRLGLGFRF